MGVWLLIIVLAVCVLALAAKLVFLRHDLYHLSSQLHERLMQDTNAPLTSASRDRALRTLAATLNKELKTLRQQRLRYENGDRELKRAVTNISHDLRTPLTAISATLDLLDDEEKSDTVARSLALIRNRTDAMTRLTEDLFRYSVILAEEKPLACKPLILNDVLAESLAAFYDALTARGITPDIHLCETRITRTLNRDALARIFANILNNALKYSDGDLAVNLNTDGSITFANHAANLDKTTVGQLFDRFFTVEAAHHSTGLGLSIARTLVKQMNGEITAAYADGMLIITVQF